MSKISENNQLKSFVKVYDKIENSLITTIGVSPVKTSRGTIQPEEIPIKALWDTGCDMSCITDMAVERLNLKPSYTFKRTGNGEKINGFTMYLHFNASMVIPLLLIQRPWICQDFDIVIGMDLITNGNFYITNERSQSRLIFEAQDKTIEDYMSFTEPGRKSRFAGTIQESSDDSLKSIFIRYAGIADLLRMIVGVSPWRKEYSADLKFEEVLALWDTGAEYTQISSWLANKMGLTPVAKSLVNINSQGTYDANIYMIILLLSEDIIMPIPVIETSKDIGFGILIGMDIIKKGSFAVTNVNSETVLNFSLDLPGER